MFDLIIVGAGPAGMSAAIYAVRQKINFVVIAQTFGGQVAKKEVEIENYPGFGRIAAPDLIARFRQHLELFNIEIKIVAAQKLEQIQGGFLVSTGAEEFETKTVIIATGAAPRFLGVPGEQELIGRGVGYCVTCDGPLFSNRNVAVAGGGNAAFESAVFLTKFAKKIYILEAGHLIRADAANQATVLNSGKAEIITNAKIQRIEGDKFVKGVTYQDVVSGRENTIAVEGVFVKIGNRPASEIVGNLADLNDRGEIIFNHETHQTKTPGLFVAGDVGDIKYKQTVIAAAEGAKAALAAEEYLRKISNDK